MFPYGSAPEHVFAVENERDPLHCGCLWASWTSGVCRWCPALALFAWMHEAAIFQQILLFIFVSTICVFPADVDLRQVGIGQLVDGDGCPWPTLILRSQCREDYAVSCSFSTYGCPIVRTRAAMERVTVLRESCDLYVSIAQLSSNYNVLRHWDSNVFFCSVATRAARPQTYLYFRNAFVRIAWRRWSSQAR